MRLCHVSPHLPPDQAANALLPAELGKWAAERRHDVRFVTQEPAQGRPALTDSVVKIRRVSAKRSTSPAIRALRIDTWLRARAIATALDDMATGVHLLHLHSNGLIIEVAAEWARRRKIPYVVTLYGTEIWHYRKRWPIDPFTRAYRHAAEVTFYSQRLHDRAVSLGLGRPGLSVIYPAVNSAFVPADAETRAKWRAELGINEPVVILNVKRLHELAGQRFLVDAFARISRGRHNLRLVICGTGPLRQELETQARSLGASAKITFTGLVPNDVVARYAAVADVFALPSLLEALPTVAVEALAAGTPVVSADHPGGQELHEIFGDDVLVVPRQDVDALAAALTDAVERPQRTRPETMTRLRERFSPEAVEAAYAQVYGRVSGQEW